MKKMVINIFATTGISLVMLSVVALFYSAGFLCIETVFQVFLVNAIVHFILFLTRKMETKYAVVEIGAEMILVIVLPLAFGAGFHWFTSTPVSVLILMSAAIYAISLFLNILHMKREAEEINRLIRLTEKTGNEV